MGRRYAGPGITFLLGAGWQLTGWENEPIGLAIMAVAALWAIALLPIFKVLALERGARGDGFAIRVRPPVLLAKRRLREETLALVKDIHAYVADQPPRPATSPKWHAAGDAHARGDTDEARWLWSEDTQENAARYEQERRALAQLFGGRITHLATAFQRRGMLTPTEASKLEWSGQSLSWLTTAAKELEGLARQL